MTLTDTLSWDLWYSVRCGLVVALRDCGARSVVGMAYR
jgi:hypothetical protein